MSDQTQAREQELLTHLRQGDASAVRAWVDEYAGAIKKYLSAKISNELDVEEILQDIFINCLRQLSLFVGKASLKTWMMGVARHEVADYYRKQYAKKIIKTLPLHELILSEPLCDASQVSTRVRVVLNKMRADYQELLLLKYVDGKQVKRIAQDLGRSIKSVEADLFRARKNFRELYAVTRAS